MTQNTPSKPASDATQNVTASLQQEQGALAPKPAGASRPIISELDAFRTK